ncbi:hypothetical protein ACFFRR_000768 [Megaselia abdita]
MNRYIVAAFAIIALYEFQAVQGHGMMLKPVSRSSRWRYDSSAPADYSDNEKFCGGTFVMHQSNGGRCGLCGDNYQLPTPRPNELGGTYGQGVITERYTKGAVVNVDVKITTNHKGYFVFDACNLDTSGKESEECFNRYPLELVTGGYKYEVPSGNQVFTIPVRLPWDLSCKHCVIRWTYTAGNNWGICADGSGAVGCGPQETYRNCGDVSIFA